MVIISIKKFIEDLNYLIMESFILVCSKLSGLSFNIIANTTIFFNWDSLHARLNSHYKAWSYKKKKHKKIKAYRKYV